MTLTNRVLTVVVAGLALTAAACKTTPPPKPTGVALTEADLTALYMSGQPTVSEGSSIGSSNVFRISRDGAGNQIGAGVNMDWSDAGTYRIDGDQVCSAWKELRNGAEACTSIYRRADGTYEWADDNGNLRGTFKLQSPS